KNFIQHRHVRHIFLGHGDSEKRASCNPFFTLYDEIWTAGQAHIDRCKHSGLDFSQTRFRIVGRPQARPLLQAAADDGPSQHIAYLPTWEGIDAEQNYTSIEQIAPLLPDI